MPPVKYAPGAKSPGTPSEYTDAQWKALRATFQTEPRLRYNAARAEFMNHAMLASGEIRPLSGNFLSEVLSAVEKGEAADRTRLVDFLHSHQQQILNDSLDAPQRQELVLMRTWARHELVEEVAEHLRQQRFLFILDDDLIPRIYFQCAVPENPDVELAADDES